MYTNQLAKALETKNSGEIAREMENNKDRELEYALSQLLTGHGCFRQYLLHRSGRGDSDFCPYCEDGDYVRHTFFVP